MRRSLNVNVYTPTIILLQRKNQVPSEVQLKKVGAWHIIVCHDGLLYSLKDALSINCLDIWSR